MRRTVSTSGSSGIPACVSYLLQSGLGGSLLRFFLRVTFPLATHVTIDLHRGTKRLVVIGPIAVHLVHRFKLYLCEHFLQSGLVAVSAGRRRSRSHHRI